MNLKDIKDDIELLGSLSDNPFAFLESVATSVEFAAGSVVFDEDAPADSFFIITEGRVGLELITPAQTPIVLQTLRDGDLVGVSWLVPPHRWSWRARAIDDTKAIEFDAAAVRDHLPEDCELERELLRAVAKAAAGRLNSSRTQLLDLYGVQT